MTKKVKTNFSLLEIESESMELEDILNQPLSPNLKRYFFISFFEKLAAQKEQEIFRSYYLQFESYVPKLCEGIVDANWDPKRILQLKQIMNNFSKFASNAQMGVTLAGINISLIAAAALSYLYVGEPIQVALLLGLDSLEQDPFHEEMSEIEKGLKLYQIANDRNNPILKMIEPYIKKWEHSQNNFSSGSIHILLVDDFSSYHKAMECEGKIVSLSGVVRERPPDVEEDRIILNNRVQMEEGSLYYSLLDSITAGKQITGLPAVSNRHYSFQFSVSEKYAELFGNSIGAGAGVLAYT